MDYPHLLNAKSKADLKHDCEQYLELRARKKGNGHAYAYQCQFCGAFRGQELSKKKIKDIPPPESLYLSNLFDKKEEELTKQEETTSESDHFKELTEKITEIDNLISNYCYNNNVEPNSLISTYLIRQRESHLKDNYYLRWHNEQELCTWFSESFSQWFEIYNEVPGIGYVNRKPKELRIDFIIKAKEVLLNHGFTNQYIGVEVKYLNPLSGHGFHGKSSRGVFQALSYWYSGARWNLPHEQNVELATVLMFSNLSFYDEANLIFNTMDSHYKKIWHSYLSIANHSNVGELVVREKQNKVITWAMEYSRVRYYSMNSEVGFIKGNPNLINKNRIGSQK